MIIIIDQIPIKVTEVTKMSERSLDNVIRHLRIAMTYLDTSMEIADKVLCNHQVATEIQVLNRQVKDYMGELDKDYREYHFAKRRRR